MLNSYTIVKEIAKTAHFLVFEAIRNKDGKPVALKVLVDRDNAPIRKRFQNEARLLKSFNHPNIVKLIEQDLEANNPWIAMPLFKGNLLHYMKALGEGAIDEKLSVFERVLDAVEHSHEQRIWHRDIKFENVLVNDHSDVVLIDFNIALCEPCNNTRITQDGTPMGTPFLMAPEQITAPSTADARTDVFLVGALLYRMLGGSVGGAVLDLDLLPARYRSFVQRAMQARPMDRYPDASEMKRVWHLLHDSAQQQSEINEIGVLATNPAISDSQIEQQSQLLLVYVGNGDLVNEFFMQSDEEVLQRVVAARNQGFERVMSSWLSFILSQQWPWEYADKVSSRCCKIFQASELASLKAEIVVALLKLAHAHHRFRVWREAASLIAKFPRDSESLTLIVSLLLSELSLEECSGAAEYLEASRTPVEIRNALTPLRRVA